MGNGAADQAQERLLGNVGSFLAIAQEPRALGPDDGEVLAKKWFDVVRLDVSTRCLWNF